MTNSWKMDLKFVCFVLILMVNVRCSVLGSKRKAPTEITAPAGTFKGAVKSSMQGHLYRAFTGIPYAKPPVGKLRFAKPEPIHKFDKMYDATNAPPNCIQPKGVELDGPAQEDCLYLNVYVPMEENMYDDDEHDSGLKVFVFIHGGGYFLGSSREYVPGDLVTLGNVIVVTMNYRLSWLGFLKGNSSKLPGNQGMWDQLMALQWVNKNIKSFGGNPNAVTLAGSSVGGQSVSAWSILYQGQHLFQRAVIMSGSIFTSNSNEGTSDDLVDLLTDEVGCKTEGTEETVECLWELPAENFSLPANTQLAHKFHAIDGELFPVPVSLLLGYKDYLKSVGFYDRDYLVTVTNNEGAVHFWGPLNIGKDPDDISADFFSQHTDTPLIVSKKVMDWYNAPGHYSYKPAHDMIYDPIAVVPPFKFLETFASYEKGLNKSYFLLFDHEPTYVPSTLDGVVHALDLTYLFDLEPDKVLSNFYNARTELTFEDEDFKLKNLYIEMLASFIKTGDPGIPFKRDFNIEWPAFDLESEKYLNFDTRPSIQQFPLRDRRHFWNNLYPKYMDAYYRSHRVEL